MYIYYLMILVNNQLDEQILMYVYFYCLHVSGSHVPIIWRIIVSLRHLVYVTCVDERLVCRSICSSTQSDINQLSQ